MNKGELYEAIQLIEQYCDETPCEKCEFDRNGACMVQITAPCNWKVRLVQELKIKIGE